MTGGSLVREITGPHNKRLVTSLADTDVIKTFSFGLTASSALFTSLLPFALQLTPTGHLGVVFELHIMYGAK